MVHNALGSTMIMAGSCIMKHAACAIDKSNPNIAHYKTCIVAESELSKLSTS